MIDQPLRVLHVEDNLRDRELVRTHLDEQALKFEMVYAGTAKELEHALEHSRPGMILADYTLPFSEGPAVLQLACDKCPETPFIFVSGTIGEARAVEALKAGATDYVFKHQLQHLVPAVQRALRQTNERTERRRAEESLRESEFRLRLATRASNVGLWDWDIESNRAYFSPEWKAQLGYQDDELHNELGEWERLLHPEDRARGLASVRASLEKPSSTCESEYRLRHKDGSYRWIFVKAQAFSNEQGRLVRLLGCHLDITQRKQAEEALKQASQNEVKERKRRVKRDLVLTLGAGAFVFGMSHAFDISKPFFQWIIDHSHLSFDKMALAGAFLFIGLAIFAVRRWKESDRSVFAHQQTEKALQTLHAELEVRVQQRTGELARANNVLHESEARFRLIAETITGVFWMTSADWKTILYVSPAYEKVWGRSCARLCADPLARLEFIHPEDHNLVKQAAATNYANHPAGIEYRIHRPDGEIRWIHDRAFEVRDAAGQVSRIVGIADDITVRKQAEGERGQIELQLHQAQKLESIGRLAAGVAHEINTPTQYIGDNIRFVQESFAQLQKVLAAPRHLLDAAHENRLTPELLQITKSELEAADVDFLSEEIPKAIGETLHGVESVARIVRAMKEFSHPGTTEKAQVDLNHSIESTLTVARNEWKYVAEMVTDFDPQLPPVMCLPGEFNQVILNLVINAAHAVGDALKEQGVAKGTITVSTRHEGNWVEVRIRDTGTGIPESVRGKMFEPFFTTKGVGKGTGQGLAIARSVIVDKHGGTIRFETETGKGTVFIIQIPVASMTRGGNL